jgi:simple sugar transport system ATP-binding protein
VINPIHLVNPALSKSPNTDKIMTMVIKTSLEHTNNFVLEFRGITKRFPPNNLANDHITFGVKQGSIHVILGENGAGKSTLMNILYGLYQPDEGSILLRGKEVHITSPRRAIELGIGMVHQHFKLVETHTVLENIVLGLKNTPFTLPNKKLEEEIKNMSNAFRLPVDPQARIWQLSLGEQQRVEILKALYRGAKILILDEPTSVLTPREIEGLFSTLHSMKKEGKTCIFITHKLEEAVEIADTITVLRKGKVVGSFEPTKVTLRELAELVVGKSIELTAKKPQVSDFGETVLEVSDLWATGDRNILALQGVSFHVRAREIVGIAGISGNGQKELVEILSGLRYPKKGKIIVNGKEFTKIQPADLLQEGIAYIPEDRRLALVEQMNISENLVLRSFHRSPFAKGPWINWKKVKEKAARLVKEYAINPQNIELPVGLLSGGNKQRVVLARELSRHPRLIIAAQPTVGLDIAGTTFIHQLLLENSSRGSGVLLVSSDLDEVMLLADTILVFFRGKIIGKKERPQQGWSEEDLAQIGLWMGGVKGETR